MINSLKEVIFSKEEGNTSDLKISNASSSSSIPWSRLRNPRIVRVSRVFGGKDRHSKVSTVRGLRDRRVRLSVPTAIQLYDLQHKLGLNQPSKVVDWLLNAAKNDIDELPPLPIQPGNYFGQTLQPMLTVSGTAGSSHSDKEGFKFSSSTVNWNELPFKQSRPNFWSSDINRQKDESKEDSVETDEEEKHALDLETNVAYVSSDYNFFPRSTHSSLPAAGLLNNYLNPSNPFLGLNPSHLFQREYAHDVNVFPLPSTFSGSQLLLRPPGIAHPYLSSNANHSLEFDPKQINFQMLSSSTSSQNPSSSNSLTPPFFTPMRPFHFSMTTNFFPSQNNNGREPSEEDN